MDNSLIVEGFNITDLSDEELGERLQNLGFNPGPILGSTRSVYQRKLARLLRNETFVEESEDAAEDGEVRPSAILHSTFLDSPASSSFASPPHFTATPTLNYDDLRRRPLPRDNDHYPGSPTSSYASPKPWSIDDIVTQAPPPPPEPEKPLLSPTAKLVLLLGLLLFAVFVYYNMESTPVDPFTASTEPGV